MMSKSTSVVLSYLYRDNGNYKQYGEAVFSNSSNLTIEQIRGMLINNLIDGEFFVAKDWGLPELFFNESNEDDHGWHEFHSIEITNENANSGEIEGFLDRITSTTTTKK